LKEVHLPWSGVTCSIIELIKGCKSFIENVKALSGTGSDMMIKTFLSNRKETFTTPGEGKPIHDVLNSIKDALYSSGQDIRTIYENCSPNAQNKLQRESFISGLMHEYGAPINEKDLFRAFNYLSQGQDFIVFDIFEEALNWQGDFRDVSVLKKIRQWMYQSGLSSEETFDALCRIKSDPTDKRLTRVDFHKGIIANKIGMSAAQIDHAFQILDSNRDGVVDFEEWLKQVYEDAHNPLQLLREVIA
jgi:hypothetical protein